jgi:hypothetical protein
MIYISYFGNIYNDENNEISKEKIINAINNNFDVYIEINNKFLYDEDFINKYKSNLWFNKDNINLGDNYNYINGKKFTFLPENDKKIIIRNYEGIISNYIHYYRQSLSAINRYGMLIAGRIKCYDENLIENILKYLNENPNEWIDIHININDNKYNLENYLNMRYMKYPFIATLNSLNYEINQYYIDIYNKKKTINNPMTLMSSFYTLMKAFCQLNYYKNENKINYDLIIKYRSDIVCNKIPDLNKYLYLKKEDKKIITPSNYRYGEEYIANDQIGIGNYNSMSIYCNVYPYIDIYEYNNISFHPETLLAFHLYKNNIEIDFFDYNDYYLNLNRR